MQQVESTHHQTKTSSTQQGYSEKYKQRSSSFIPRAEEPTRGRASAQHGDKGGNRNYRNNLFLLLGHKGNYYKT